MSMPGFVFHFRCDSCDATSHDYSLFAFSDIFHSNILLPGWSMLYKCWATLNVDLSSAQRKTMASDRNALLAFARSFSSEGLAVGVPEFAVSHSQSFDVSVSPTPLCPYCGLACQTVFGYPPRELPPDFAPITADEFRTAPLSLIDLSVRSMMIARDLNLRTVGQLESARFQFEQHPQATDATITEVQDLLSRMPNN